MSNETFSSLEAEQEKLQKILLAKANTLVESVESGDLSGSIQIINTLYQFRHEVFYREVGALTRTLHDAIKDFGSQVDDQLDSDHNSSSAVTNATDRLRHVVEMTENHANETLDRVENAMTLVDQLSDQTDLPAEAGQKLVALKTLLNDILVSQSVQDITGQLIGRVIGLLTDIETQLVSLIHMSAKIERLRDLESGLTGDDHPSGDRAESRKEQSEQTTKDREVKAEGPQIDRNAKDVLHSQDEVDDLLSSLGF